ncbi:CBS domain-containing protein [Candidatus Woesearchaeota archaeon]|nr:CBS domain-containing protein [Candidatus Woesearchaeota archaeon]
MNKRGALFGFLPRGWKNNNPYPELLKCRVRDYMTKDVMTIDRQKSLIQAAHTMIGAHVSCLVVTEDAKPKGIITERDFIKKLPMEKEPKTEILVDELMTKKVVSVDSDVDLFEAQRLMKKNGFRKLVVAEKGELAGIITQTDLCKAVAELRGHLPEPPIVQDVMTKSAVSVSSEEGFLKVKSLMSQKGMGSVIVADDGEIQGMFTEFDIVSEFFMNPNKLKNSCMRELMTSPVVCVTPLFDLEFVNKLMIQKNFRRLPVMEDGKIVGIITQTDVARSLYQHFEKNKDKKYPKKWGPKDPYYTIIKKGSTILYNLKQPAK